MYLATRLEDTFVPVMIEAEGQAVQVFLLPYFDTAQAREFLGDDSLKGEENACMEAILQRMAPQFAPGAAHVLVAHCFGRRGPDLRLGERGPGGGQRAGVPPPV